MKVSIVIPTKNEETVLPGLFETIERQSFRNFEVIVADAYSTDRTRDLATAAGACVVDGGMPGPGRNRGAAVASGDLLLFMDADAALPNERYLGDCATEFERCGADVATCRLEPMSARLGDRLGHAAFNAYTRAFARVRPHAAGSCIWARRTVHDAIGGFDERVTFAEDHEYAQRARRYGYRFCVLDAHPMHVSVRRLEQDGRFNVAVKYLYSELYMIAKGPLVNRELFEYRFDHFDRSKKEHVG